jgi:hypothetical protein
MTYFWCLYFVLILFSKPCKETCVSSFECGADYFKALYCLIDNLDHLPKLEKFCKNNTTRGLNINIFSSVPSVLDEQVDISNCSVLTINLINIKSISLIKRLFIVSSKLISLNIYNSDFNFIYNQNASDSVVENNIFNSGLLNIFFVDYVKYYKDTPTLIFKDSYIPFMTINGLSNTTILSNFFTFKKHPLTRLNSTIQKFDIYLFNLELNNKIIDDQVFVKLERINIYNQLIGIELGTFEALKYLKKIKIIQYSLRKFFHSVGIDWLRSVNIKHKVDFKTHKIFNKNDFVVILFMQSQTNMFSQHLNEYDYPNEDFCIFKNFPFENQVFFSTQLCLNTSTFQWLTQYKWLNYSDINNCNLSNPSSDQFEVFKQACDLNADEIEHDSRMKEYQHENELLYYFNDKEIHLRAYEYFLAVILLPTISICGIIFNFINIMVLSNTNFKKELKDKMFAQMLHGSQMNIFISFIYFLKLMIKCIDPVKSFCIISIISNRTLRFSILLVVNYLGNVLKTCTNLNQISISIDRFVISSDLKNKFLKKMTQIKPTSYFIYSVLFSSTINVVKLFEYDNDMNVNMFKFPSLNPYFFDIAYFYWYLNVLNLFISNIFFSFIQILINVFLLVYVKKSLANKLKLTAANDFNKKFKEKRNTEKKIKMLIIINGFCLFILHMPDLIISFFFIFSKKNYLLYIQSYTFFSNIFSDLSDICYIFEYSLNFMIFYFFNNQFKASFKNLIGIKK